MDENYKPLAEFISQQSGLTAEEIDRRVEAKRAKLAGLISKEGALQVIAAELNINFDKQLIKISQIAPGMRKINIVGKVINLFPIREYNKNGRSGRIGSFVLADDTSNIRTVLWDENHIGLIANGQIYQEGVVEITNATFRNGELHLTSFSEIKSSNKNVGNIVISKPVLKKEIAMFNPNDNVTTRAFIVQMFEPKFFNVCVECRKKVSDLNECNIHGKVVPEKKALLSFVLDDGTDSIRAVMFSDQLEKIFTKEELETQELFAIKKTELLGKEVLISGQVRRNPLYNSNEFMVNGIEEINLDQLIEELDA
jgi:replication factor A1